MLQCQCTTCLNTAKIYRKTADSLWNYYRGEPSNPLSSNTESFKYKTSITGSTDDSDDDAEKVGKNEATLVIPVEHLSNFWITLNIRLINCRSGFKLVKKLRIGWYDSKSCRK